MSTDLLARVAAHFDAMRGKTLEVPEWGPPGEPLVVHFDPLTLADRQALEASARGDDAKAALLVVIRHAKDANGARLFDDGAQARATLERNADPAVFGRIAQAIIRAGGGADLGE